MLLIHHKYFISRLVQWQKLSLFFWIYVSFMGIAIGQTSYKDKNKTLKIKDSVTKAKLALAKSEKLSVLTDTLKKPSTLFDAKAIGLDSLFIVSGKYKLHKKGAHASYYADKFHNKKTASGKRYDKNKYSAAHKKFPFGTILKVTNEANGKSVFVEVTDRGPFVRSREIDLSRKAFMEITNNKASGNMNVTIEVLQK
jgi:rare lipoprotein A